MNLKIENKCKNWRRAMVAPKLIKLRIEKQFKKKIRSGEIIAIKIDKSLNELLWKRGPKNLGKYINLKTEINNEKILIIFAEENNINSK